MICQSNPRNTRPTTELQEESSAASVSRIYDRRFWFAFSSNMCTAVAVALLFRYADLIRQLGGGEFELGWIVGIGMVGSVVIRFVLGRAVDRHGAGTIWLGSLVVLAVSCFGHLLLSTCHGPSIYVLRIMFASAIAGVFGASMTWVSARVPKVRIAEIIGTLGASGFIAWAIGNYLGDLLARGPNHVTWIFVAAGTVALVALVFCRLATMGSEQRTESPCGSTARVIWRHSPRVVLLVGIATGLVIGLPMTFLRTFTEELGIVSMTSFFGVYATVALLVRIIARRFPERFGLAPVILFGLFLMTGGMLAFLVVESAWQLAIPAVILGAAHAIVFPPTVAASTISFPEACRGLGTMLILAAYDFGVLIGAPLAGIILQYSGHLGMPSYPTLFITMASLVGLIGLLFAASLLRPRPRVACESVDASVASDAKDTIGNTAENHSRPLRLYR